MLNVPTDRLYQVRFVDCLAISLVRMPVGMLAERLLLLLSSFCIAQNKILVLERKSLITITEFRLILLS